jgi:hypothetical protein
MSETLMEAQASRVPGFVAPDGGTVAALGTRVMVAAGLGL